MKNLLLAFTLMLFSVTGHAQATAPNTAQAEPSDTARLKKWLAEDAKREALAASSAEKEERALAERYNLPPDVVKFKKEPVGDQTARMAAAVVQSLAKECAAGVKTSCLPQADEPLIPPATQIALIKALVMALATALLVGVIAYFRRPK